MASHAIVDMHAGTVIATLIKCEGMFSQGAGSGLVMRALTFGRPNGSSQCHHVAMEEMRSSVGLLKVIREK